MARRLSTFQGPGRLPWPFQLVPWLGLIAIAVVINVWHLAPPQAQCAPGTGGIPWHARFHHDPHLLFIRLTAVAFALVAVAFVVAARSASARRRGGVGPSEASRVIGWVVIAVAALGALAPRSVGAVIPVVLMVAAGVSGTLLFGPVLLLIALTVCGFVLKGPRGWRVAQPLAWIGALYVLPVVMLFTYMRLVAMFCFVGF